jgi:copper chaperone NosL
MNTTPLFILCFAVSLVLVSCNAQPETLKYGQDYCHLCKMTLMDKKFGAEIVTKKGKVYKFDDLNCMINFHNSGYEDEANMKYRLVVDFARPETLIEVEHTFFVKTDQIRTPMASQVAAFSSEEEYRKFNAEWKGILLSWGEVRTQFK